MNYTQKTFEEVYEGQAFWLIDPRKYERTSKYSLVKFTKLALSQRPEPRQFYYNATANVNTNSLSATGFFPVDALVFTADDDSRVVFNS
jgi:hypothetical protein